MLRGKHERLGRELELRGAARRALEEKSHAADRKVEGADLGKPDELGEHPGTRASVGVRDGKVASGRPLQREVERLLTGARVGVDHLDPQVALGKGVEQAKRGVRRPGVHDDELELPERLVLDALDRAAHGAAGVMGCHEHRDKRRCGRTVRQRNVPPRGIAQLTPLGYQRERASEAPQKNDRVGVGTTARCEGP